MLLMISVQALKNQLYTVLQSDLRQDLMNNVDKYEVKYNYMLLTLFCNLTDENNMGKLFIKNIII